MTYGCKKYRVKSNLRVENSVKEVMKDHNLPRDTNYMDDKIMCASVGIGDSEDVTFLLWEGDRTRDKELSYCDFSTNERIPNRVVITKGD